ncbi:uncharacterized protein LOC129965826 isoform X3 [Argiope bruennichi]|uniref:uncharacterized protein LOC129965826 isoform X3 n=1 Tax=Argiope bruennichi TaxID=94029 RepID=UPI0024943C03|nr:uncharacterized protein LOC129965826 isoform X3 [Argiope bruennichi]
MANTDSFMAPCTLEEDCDAGIRLICQGGRCICKQGDLFIEWPKYGCFSKVHMFGQCEVSGQCVAMNSNTYCNPDNGRCTCSPNYFYNGRECILRYDGSNLKAQEVYKAAVVAAACFIVAIVGIFVACIVRRCPACRERSFCRRDQHLQQSGSNRDGDIFSISDEIAALRAVDKPPSYEEVLQIERTFYGIPPPEYAPTPRIISSLSAFEPNTNRPAPIPLPYNPNYVPPSVPQAGVESSSSREYLKGTNSVTEGAVGGSSDPPIAEAAANFLAAAEVLSPPSETRESIEVSTIDSPSISENSSHHVQSHYISSTPPPPRLNRLNLQSTPSGSSSSLPGSPNLCSFRVLNLPNPLRKGLLKQNSSPSEHISDSHVSTETSSQICSRNSPPSTSGSQNQVISASHNNSENNLSELAYDNPGFVSDLQA